MSLMLCRPSWVELVPCRNDNQVGMPYSRSSRTESLSSSWSQTSAAVARGLWVTVLSNLQLGLLHSP